jgi:hypothetical protein
MQLGERVAVYCENHTEHTDTVRTSQETHYVSATEPNRLILFRETVAVYCENHTEQTCTVWALLKFTAACSQFAQGSTVGGLHIPQECRDCCGYYTTRNYACH